MIQFHLLRIGQLLDRALPRSVAYAVASAAGDVAFWCWPTKRANAIANAAQVLGRAEGDPGVRAVARRSFRNYARYLAEFIHLPRECAVDVAQRCSHVVGYEHLEAAVARGRGTIVVTAHFGNWDLAGAVLATRHPLVVVADTLQPPELDRLVRRTRAEKGMRVVPSGCAVRALLRSLRRNEVVALLADRPALDGVGSVVVSFFGCRTAVPAGAAALALRTGAAVLPAGCWRRPDDAYVGVLAPPIHCAATGQYRRDLEDGMQRIMAALEGVIRRAPDQWYMFRRMWPPALASSPTTALAAAEAH